MSQMGRSILMKVTLFAIVTLIALTLSLSLSTWAIDKKRRAFLWRGSEVVHGGDGART